MAWAGGYDMYGNPIQYDMYGNPLVGYPGYAMANPAAMGYAATPAYQPAAAPHGYPPADHHAYQHQAYHQLPPPPAAAPQPYHQPPPAAAAPQPHRPAPTPPTNQPSSASGVHYSSTPSYHPPPPLYLAESAPVLAPPAAPQLSASDHTVHRPHVGRLTSEFSQSSPTLSHSSGNPTHLSGRYQTQHGQGYQPPTSPAAMMAAHSSSTPPHYQQQQPQDTRPGSQYQDYSRPSSAYSELHSAASYLEGPRPVEYSPSLPGYPQGSGSVYGSPVAAQGSSTYGSSYSSTYNGYGFDYYGYQNSATSYDVYQSHAPQHSSAAGVVPTAASIAMAAAIQTESYSLLSHGLVVDQTDATAGQSQSHVNQLSDEELSKKLEVPASATLFLLHNQTRPVKVFLSPGAVHLHIGTQSILLRDIDAIRMGCKTSIFTKRAIVPDPGRCFSIQYGLKTLDLEVPDAQSFELWTSGLIRLVAGIREIGSDYAHVKGAWFKAGKEKLSAEDVCAVLNLLGLSPTVETIHQWAPGVDLFDFSSFLPLLRRCRERSEIKYLFYQYTKGTEAMSCAQLVAFVTTEQRDTDFDVEHAVQIISQFGDRVTQALSCEGFETYLTSSRWNSFESPKICQVYQDMTRPLHEYFISSSHNTYLEGHQLTGKSSSEMYVRVLKTGCRCIELDCWDGSDGEPVITHGNTLTSKISFEEVLRAIKKFAFFASEYPLVLSIENHTSQPQQARMATMFQQYFADMMAPSTRYDSAAASAMLMSPEQLKRCIVLKGPIGSESPVPTEKDIIYELSKLIHLGPTQFSLDPAIPPYRMTSLSENKLKSIPPIDLVRVTQMRLIRTYPSGTRTDSSNPDPVVGWIAGCQMAALNYQDPSTPLLLNFVKFADNGGCGYLLKPPYLRADPRFNPYSIVSNGNPFPEIRIRVLSARQLPSPKEAREIAKEATPASLRTGVKNIFNKVKAKVSKGPAPELVQASHVTIEVHGVPIDCKKVQTTTVPNGAFGPSWDEVFSFVFRGIDLAIFTISIVNSGTNTKLCHAGIPASCLRSGYRVIPMREPSLKYLPMTDLFCQFIVS